MPAPFEVPPTAIEDAIWPALPTGLAGRLLALQQQFDQTQWWPPELLQKHQLRQAGLLLDHALRTVPFYGRRLAEAGYRPGQDVTAEFWRRLPILTRPEVQAQGAALHSTEPPPSHGPLLQDSTSGSTGMPVKLVKTELAQLLWHALTLREEIWHRRDWSSTLGVIRRDPQGGSWYPAGSRHPNWGPPLAWLYPTGPGVVLDNRTSIDQQADWLAREDPSYLLSFPSLLLGLARQCRENGVRLKNLRGVRTFGEVLDPGLRAACREAWGVGLVDMYSAVEAGYIALQCPEHERYHVQSETVIVEVLDAAGEPCRPGAIGRLVLTPLQNFAMPLIRYEIGDYAERGGPCPCGRGLPVLTRITGRGRDMVTLPSGLRQFARVGYRAFADFDDILQYQVVQKTLHDLEVRLVARQPLGAEQQAKLAQAVIADLGYAFAVAFTYHDEIPRTAGGKYFDFLSEIAE